MNYNRWMFFIYILLVRASFCVNGGEYPAKVLVGWQQDDLVDSSWGSKVKLWGKFVELDCAITNTYSFAPYIRVLLSSASPYRYGIMVSSSGEDFVADEENIKRWEEVVVASYNKQTVHKMSVSSASAEYFLTLYDFFCMSAPPRMFGSLFLFDRQISLHIGGNVGPRIFLWNSLVYNYGFFLLNLLNISGGFWCDIGSAAVQFQVNKGNTAASYQDSINDVLENKAQSPRRLQAYYNTGVLKSVWIDCSQILCGFGYRFDIINDMIHHSIVITGATPIRDMVMYYVRPDTRVGADTSRFYSYKIPSYIRIISKIRYDFGCEIMSKNCLLGLSFVYKKAYYNSVVNPLGNYIAKQMGFDTRGGNIPFSSPEGFMAKGGYILSSESTIICALFLAVKL